MSVDPVSFIPAGASVSSLLESNAVPANKTESNFESWLTQQITEVNNQLEAADINVRRLATGEATNLHEIMMSLEKAKMSFELLLKVRNKALEGYQEIMRMQI